MLVDFVWMMTFIARETYVRSMCLLGGNLAMGGKATIWGGGNPTIKRGKSGYIVGFPRGKGYYIASFPGERLLYSQFSGGKSG